jgi:hypothetical protein
MRGVLRDEFEAHLHALESSGLLEGPAIWQPWNQFISAEDESAWSRAWLLGTLGAWFQESRRPLDVAPDTPDEQPNPESLLQ